MGSDLGVWGCHDVSQWDPEQSPGRQRFFVYADKILANFWPPMHKHTAAEMC